MEKLTHKYLCQLACFYFEVSSSFRLHMGSNYSCWWGWGLVRLKFCHFPPFASSTETKHPVCRCSYCHIFFWSLCSVVPACRSGPSGILLIGRNHFHSYSRKLALSASPIKVRPFISESGWYNWWGSIFWIPYFPLPCLILFVGFAFLNPRCSFCYYCSGTTHLGSGCCNPFRQFCTDYLLSICLASADGKVK